MQRVCPDCVGVRAKSVGSGSGPAHAYFRSVYGLSRLTCHRVPGPPKTWVIVKAGLWTGLDSGLEYEI